MLIQVALSDNIFQPLTYSCPDSARLQPGSRVVVPLMNRMTTGWITGLNPSYSGPVKKIAGIVQDDFFPGKGFMEFIFRVSRIFICSPGLLLDYALPPQGKGLAALMLKLDGKMTPIKNVPAKKIRAMSSRGPLPLFLKSPLTISQPPEERGAPSAAGHSFHIARDHLAFIKKILGRYHGRRNVLLLCPDNETARQYSEAIPEGILYNSSISPSKRGQIWQHLHNTSGNIIIGGLSAVFLPVSDPAAVIYDKSVSFKSYRPPGIDLELNKIAQMRAESCSGEYFECSSSPSINALLLQDTKKASITDRRPEKHTEIEVRKLSGKKKMIPADLIEEVREWVSRKFRVLIISSKKSSSRYPFCFECNSFLKCSSCGGLVYYNREGRSECLICKTTARDPSACPRCNKGTGTVRDISLEALRSSLITTLGSDQVFLHDGKKSKNPGDSSPSVRNQAVTLSSLSLIGPRIKDMFDRIVYLQPESFFDFSRFSGSETLYHAVKYLGQLIKKDGQVIIYSSFHFHYSLKYINSEDDFMDREKAYRRWFELPPYSDLYIAEIKARTLRDLGEKMRGLYKKYQTTLNIKKIRLKSRKKTFGFYRGILELHPQEGKILHSGLVGEKQVLLKRENS